MNAYIERSLRPLLCARAMVGGGFLSSPSGALFGAAERLTRAAVLLAGRLRSHRDSLPTTSKEIPVPPVAPDAQVEDDAQVDTPRVSQVEIRSSFRKDVVDEASWESFPASDPPGY